MKEYIVDSSRTDPEFAHFFRVIVSNGITDEYARFFLEVCKIFEEALDADMDHFVVRNPSVYLKDVEIVIDDKWVQMLAPSFSACVYSKEFARYFLNNIDTRHELSTVIGGMYPGYSSNMIGVNVNKLSDNDTIASGCVWGTNAYNFKCSFEPTGINFIEIKKSFENLCVDKKKVFEHLVSEYKIPEDTKILDYKLLKEFVIQLEKNE